MLLRLLRKPKPTTASAGFLFFSSPITRLFSSVSNPTPPPEPLSGPAVKSFVLSHYRHGKFHNLLQSVIASPSLLLTACRNLTPPSNSPESPPCPLTVDSISTHFFSLPELSSQLAENRFDVDSCCITVPSSIHKGKPLMLPNLKLKVVVEAVRIILEVIYDDRFVTFSYGGRVGMGRHTAIRYLKSSVENPSWWFTVKFSNQMFNAIHVKKLCSVMEEKINDKALIDLIKKLFECEAVRIDFGSHCYGGGFPQECRLSAVLINIYFNDFDKQIQDLRIKTNEENPKFKENELVSGASASGNVFYKPMKIFAVRYLDEILIITSGSKMFTTDLKNTVTTFLVKNLQLGLDTARTAIHSATSEKIEFLGMELQAVTPSVLNRPMLEKAIRAQKKYLRQKEVRLSELKNAKERSRRKLGMKILSHVFKKLKQSKGFKFDFQIENEVRHIFRIWADEVVQEFLQSVEERSEWHRKLSAGDFLSLGRIRDQLPRELVDAYDNFQEQVDKYLKPVKAKKAFEEEERRIEEEEERQYAKRTVEDLTKLRIKVDAPIELLRKAVRMVGFTNHMGRPRPISLLMTLEDVDIIKWYAGVGRRWLAFFCCCHNFRKVKTIVSYHLRFSCILTLAEKHESTKRETIGHFTKDLKVSGVNGDEEVPFPTEREVKMMGDRNLSDPKPVDGALTMTLTRLASDEPPYQCVAHFCNRTDTTVYRIRLLQNHLKVNPLDEKNWVPDMGWIHSNLHSKCIPLCPAHISGLYMGGLTLQDVDCSAFVDVD